jgi:hypothetical protein
MVSARVRIGTLAGALGGMLLGVVIGLSGGGIGPGRMVEAGPPPVTPLVIAVPALALCGALGSWAFGLWSGHYGGARGSLDRRPRVRNGDEPSGAH